MPPALPAAPSLAAAACLPQPVSQPAVVPPPPPKAPAGTTQPPPAAAPASAAPSAAAPTSKILLLKNLVSAAEVDDELPGEVRAECAKYGTITDVKIKVDDGKQVEVRVSYATTTDADNAQKAMHQRWFGGRVVVAELVVD